jgi:hypothetical protein
LFVVLVRVSCKAARGGGGGGSKVLSCCAVHKMEKAASDLRVTNEIYTHPVRLAAKPPVCAFCCIIETLISHQKARAKLANNRSTRKRTGCSEWL